MKEFLREAGNLALALGGIALSAAALLAILVAVYVLLAVAKLHGG